MLPDKIVMPTESYESLKKTIEWMEAMPKNLHGVVGDRLYENTEEYKSELLVSASAEVKALDEAGVLFSVELSLAGRLVSIVTDENDEEVSIPIVEAD